MDVSVTGAAGDVGTVAVNALEDDHEVQRITHQEYDQFDSIVLDVKDREALASAFENQDAVIHLAAISSPGGDWESYLETNIDATQAVYETAVEKDIKRVAFASTNHVQHMYNAADRQSQGGGGTRDDHRPIYPDDPFRPDSYYGVSKITGEALGCLYADRYGIEVVNMRIGWLLDEQELLDLQNASEPMARHAREMYWSHRDCRHAIRRIVSSELSENPLVANFVSRNSERSLSLLETMRELEYNPRDDSAEILADHANSR